MPRETPALPDAFAIAQRDHGSIEGPFRISGGGRGPFLLPLAGPRNDGCVGYLRGSFCIPGISGMDRDLPLDWDRTILPGPRPADRVVVGNRYSRRTFLAGNLSFGGIVASRAYPPIPAWYLDNEQLPSDCFSCVAGGRCVAWASSFGGLNFGGL